VYAGGCWHKGFWFYVSDAIEVAGPAENNKEDLFHDLASIVYSICAKLYGQRRAKRKGERLVEQLEAQDGQG
jgi:putative resolvase